MPVARAAGGKGPAERLNSQTLPHIIIFGNVFIIVEINKIVLQSARKDNESRNENRGTRKKHLRASF